MKNRIKKKEEQFEESLVAQVREDFLERQKLRRALEAQWELNMNYLAGNQYCDINPLGELEESGDGYMWQSREVFNNITPIIESRIAKLSRVRPVMSVRAAGDENGDLKTAKLAGSILNSTYNRIELDKIINSATMWSEVCGTAFYKVMWDASAGKKLGATEDGDVFEGDVRVICCPPFEIFPDSLHAEDTASLRSIIHARAVDVGEIERKYGVSVAGEELDVYTLQRARAESGSFGGAFAKIKSAEKDKALVIERYERPSPQYPNGRLITVAGDKLLFIGELPFINGADGRRELPFVRQISIARPGSYFGTSVIERLIPVQRAYNAVKNRKHEFINRMANGVLAVEDGSVDVEELAEDGLSPGKVVVYRQGSEPPKIMENAGVPEEFGEEEDRLNNEFIRLSGISEISRNSSIPSSITSGVALQLLIEQDEVRLTVTAERIRSAVRTIAQHIIRLFKQFASEERVMRSAGEGKKVEMYYFKGSDITSDDVVFDTENELVQSPAQKKAVVMELLSSGLLHDENGKISNRMRAKILEVMGFGGLDNAQDLTALHISRAESENISLLSGEVSAEEYDDHETHIAEHIRFVLSGECEKYMNKEPEINGRFTRHIAEHKKLKNG